MSVFRLQDGNAALGDGVDWFNSSEYTSSTILAMPDPNGGKGNEPTSIPSPFARMDLVNTAFQYVNSQGEKAGEMYQKIVSDSLDVAEIFFRNSLYKNLQIVEWDKNIDIAQLKASPREEHQGLAATLEMYLNNPDDRKSFNFDICQKIYLLVYDFKVIGSTSPLSLFFNTANDLSWANITFPNGDRAFDAGLCPLYDRSDDFQIWLYAMRVSNVDFRAAFREISSYMDECLQVLRTKNNALHNTIQNLTSVDYSIAQYAVCGAGVQLITGLPLYQNKPFSGAIVSDFEIASTKCIGQKPLVLQQGHKGFTVAGKPMKYHTANYDAQIEVPHYHPLALDQRELPGLTGIKYPYLTVSDFLEPYIIRTVYPINESKYFTGNLKDDLHKGAKGFLLPIKKTYFDYFSINDLFQNLRMETLAGGGVQVSLTIPLINNNSITYERIYSDPHDEGKIHQAELDHNKGIVLENQFSVSLYPFLKFPDPNRSHYRIALFDRDLLPLTKQNQYDLHFYQETGNTIVKEKAKQSRSQKANDLVGSDFYVLETDFDYMQLKHHWANGLIIPLFKKPAMGGEAFTFAVDFGTTNTHIEYRKGTADPQALEVGEADVQIASLHDPAKSEKDKSLGGSGATVLLDILSHELLPHLFGDTLEFKFPTRTSIASHINLDLSKPVYALADLNLALAYEKQHIPSNIRIRTNLKWSNYVKNPDEVKIIKTYFENLLALIANKVLRNGGDLDKTQIIWFYPSSMTIARRNILEATWDELASKYISVKLPPIKLSESIAPFYFYQKRLGIAATDRPVLGIDIGGGTTDIVVYTNNQPQILSSFRFATNAIFGDAFNGSPAINGFVLKFYDRFCNLLTTNKQYDLLKALEQIKQSGRSEDIVTFFFAIEANKNIKDKNIDISFSKELAADTDFKILFLIFYAAIIYHSAKMMKKRHLTAPRYIIFSGMGSKVIKVTDPSQRLSSLATFTEQIFSHVFDGKVENIELKQEDQPKEITCKGGLMMTNSVLNIDKITDILIGTEEDILVSEAPTTYGQLTQTDFESVAQEYTNFINMIFNVHEELDYTNYFGLDLSIMQKAKKVLLEDVMQDLKSGLEGRLQEELAEVKLEETLFFYPLIGRLNKLAFELA